MIIKKRKLNIVHIASEVEPFFRTGGLAHTTASLASAHSALGHNVSIICPYYENGNEPELSSLEVVKENHTLNGIYEAKFKNVTYFKKELVPGFPIYFIKQSKYFKQKSLNGKLYGAKNENARFLFFNLAALDLIKELNIKPDIINCHDWHTGLIPYFLKNKFKNVPYWNNVATIFTIHNLVFQLGHNWWEIDNKDKGRLRLPKMEDEVAIEKINFAKRAILNADVINTVSETYCGEVMTKNFGEDLHLILQNRKDRLFGIVNGIDFKEYNPLTDPGLHKRYSYKSPDRKKANKQWLQKKYGLKICDDPVICMTSRIAEQKGFKLILEIIDQLMQAKVQLIIMGNGAEDIISKFKIAAKKYSGKIAVVPFDSKNETSVYAGSDMFLLPSRFEPCGINQMIAMRYGTIPIVHRIGGLADTVTNFKPSLNKGNGFTFKKYDAPSLFVALVRAIETYKHKDIWRSLVLRSLNEAHSWKLPAQKYVELYRTAMKVKDNN